MKSSWIRMLSMVLGSTTHAFELMLSAFITGLAFGGLWIKKRIDRLANPVWFSGYVQFIMGFLALLTLVMYGMTFEWMGFIQAALSKSDQGYMLFNLASHLIAFGVMLPTTFLAGMTLPLFTHVLLKQGHGERSLGRVYAANTLGAISGVMFAVHIGMPNLGLKMLLIVGVVLDIGLGLTLLRHTTTVRRQFETLASAVIGIGGIAIVLSAVHLDPYRMTSGVFRHGVASTPKDNEILFYQDGKTASISLHRDQDGITILSTNGKPDAAINMNPAHTAAPDEITMTMAAVLPLLYNPYAKTVANIGMGSGMTTHTLLAYPKLQKVDTIEIEKAVIKAATGFLPRVAYAYSDPRSVFHIEDAKTYFSKHQAKYDIIVSEPSNPWVSGVVSLFSEEFYQHIKHHLSEDGVLVQWLQLYEIDTDLVASVFKALVKHFKDYVIYNTDNANILILAKKVGNLPRPSPVPFQEAALIHELARIGIFGLQDIEVRRLGDRRLFQPVFEVFAKPANSDYFPVLELNAPKTRFLGQNATALTQLSTAPLPVLEMLDQDRLPWPKTRITWNPYFGRSQKTVNALLIREHLLAGVDPVSTNLELNVRRHLYHLTTLMKSGCRQIDEATWLDSVQWLAEATLPYLSSRELQPLWADDHNMLCAKAMTSASQKRFKLYQAIGARNAVAMAALGAQLLNAPGDHLDPSWRRYLLSAAMLGHLSAQEPERALRLWKKFGAELYSDGRLPPYVVLLIRQSQTNHRLGTQMPQHANTG
jgi:spermidine synthase